MPGHLERLVWVQEEGPGVIMIASSLEPHERRPGTPLRLLIPAKQQA